MGLSVQVEQGTPPSAGNVGDALWQKWFQSVYDAALRDGGSFTKLNIIGKEMVATATTERFYFKALTWNCAQYVSYTTQQGNIAYGFAAEVRRQAGNAFTVGAQIDAIASRGATNTVFGVAIESIGEYKFAWPIVGLESTAACLDDTNARAKWGANLVFKNRSDLETTMKYGIGADRYNYFSIGLVIDALAPSSSGEKCGWTRGIAFLGDCFGTQTPTAWNATTIYEYGMVVTSGGRSWQAIQRHLNQVPAVPSAYWVFNTPAGALAPAVGIDFVSLSAASITAMASAIRLKDFMRFHWDATGAIGTYFDSTTADLILCENTGAKIGWIGVAAPKLGRFGSGLTTTAMGGGAGAALGTVGGAGPAVAAQNSWYPIDTAGGVVWLPCWQ